MTVLVLPDALRAQIGREAAAALPHECCGLIEGVRGGAQVRALVLHPAANLSHAEDRFEIDPSDHIRALRAARERGNAIVGCYHSHPGGQSLPSVLDREGAGEVGFVWLIAGIADANTTVLKAYLFEDQGFVGIPLVEAVSLDPAPAPRV